MTKKQTSRKPNAAKMSRTALIAEVRHLRKLAKRQEELDKTARALFRDTYWQNIFISYAEWFLEQIDKARADA